MTTKWGESPYIYGIHDQAGADALEGKGSIVISEEIGADRNDPGGRQYNDLADAGLGVIVRLNYGYNPKGTIPIPESYNNFAIRCGNFAEHSEGCHIWVIGNEPNLEVERPGVPIWPTHYANCYRQCRAQIKSRPGHQLDQVLTAAVGPWNSQTGYPGNENGDWIAYFRDMLCELSPNTEYKMQLDGITLHTYSRGYDPSSIIDPSKMNAPFDDYHSGFQCYRDFMAAIPEWAKVPVYITETNQNAPWENRNTGWVRAAYADIDRWNKHETQQIRCLALYRWETFDQWSFKDKQGVLDDLHEALRLEYKWGEPAGPPDDQMTAEDLAVCRRIWEAWPATMKHAIKQRRLWCDEVDMGPYILFTTLDEAGQRYGVKMRKGTWQILDEQQI